MGPADILSRLSGLDLKGTSGCGDGGDSFDRGGDDPSLGGCVFVFRYGYSSRRGCDSDRSWCDSDAKAGTRVFHGPRASGSVRWDGCRYDCRLALVDGEPWEIYCSCDSDRGCECGCLSECILRDVVRMCSVFT